ncbi:MAG: hypothetical protein IT553_02805 [Sphingomonadaceae bacterium]|nr:hypothetical protein [Sphingomonadaceae bacterium]
MRLIWIAMGLAVAALPTHAAASCARAISPGSGAQSRDPDNRVAIEYGRALGFALAARDDSAATDRLYDLTRILLPNALPSVNLSQNGGCDVADGVGSEAVERDAFVRDIAARYTIAPTALTDAQVGQFAALRDACNEEVRRTAMPYFARVMTRDAIGELWGFLVPRSGATIPANGAEPLTGARLTRLSGGALSPVITASAPHIVNRQERAAQYLTHHVNGERIMSALNQYIAAVITPAAGRATQLCPATAAQEAALADRLQ